jgi:hypothetical protein
MLTVFLAPRMADALVSTPLVCWRELKKSFNCVWCQTR